MVSEPIFQASRPADQKIRSALSDARLAIIVIGLLILSSCSTTYIPKGTLANKHPSTEVTPPTATTSIEVRDLLRQADQAVSEDRLTTPVDNNAWYRYLRVLELDPHNQHAEQGISDIVDKYLAWAIEDIEAGYLHKATKYLGKVRNIDPDHPNIAAVAKRLSAKADINQRVIELPKPGLDGHSAALANWLLRLGSQIQSQNARVVIVARNDAEGRWIYQQLNKAEAGPRIRAQIQLQAKPMLRIMTSGE